jgi:hypothetical protein
MIWHISGNERTMLDLRLMRGYSVVRLTADGSHGLYVTGMRNSFDTPLVCVGTREEIEGVLAREK